MTPADAPPQDWSARTLAGNVGRGVAMGGADIVPGVSGGTVALILGIYPRLVSAVSRVDGTLFGHLKAGRIRDAAGHLDAALLVPLVLGILTGVAALGSVMHTLLEDHRQLTLAVFFGLIAASGVFVAKLVEKWTAAAAALVCVGLVVGYVLAGLALLSTPPSGLWYVFLCGAIGICAMILPGVSGAFLLLMLGKYHEITGLIKSALKFDLSGGDVLTLAVFGCGVVVGILSFSKLLKWLLAKAPDATLAFLCGLMLGSLRKLWPFQRELTAGEDLEYKDRVFENVPVTEVTVDGAVWLTVLLAAAGAAVVLGLDWLAGHREEEQVEAMAEEPHA